MLGTALCATLCAGFYVALYTVLDAPDIGREPGKHGRKLLRTAERRQHLQQRGQIAALPALEPLHSAEAKSAAAGQRLLGNIAREAQPAKGFTELVQALLGIIGIGVVFGLGHTEEPKKEKIIPERGGASTTR